MEGCAHARVRKNCFSFFILFFFCNKRVVKKEIFASLYFTFKILKYASKNNTFETSGKHIKEH